METRQIVIANTRTQQRYIIESNATTLGELQDQLTEQGIDFEGMTFTEGISKTQLLDRDSLLPTNVMFRGEPTNNLVMLLTNTKKNIASGAMSRSEVYQTIKERNLQEDIKEYFGDNFTRISTQELENYINSVEDDDEPEEGIYEEEHTCECDKVVNEVTVNIGLVDFLYNTVKLFTESGALRAGDLIDLSNLIKGLASQGEDPSWISNEELDDMMSCL